MVIFSLMAKDTQIDINKLINERARQIMSGSQNNIKTLDLESLGLDNLEKESTKLINQPDKSSENPDNKDIIANSNNNPIENKSSVNKVSAIKPLDNKANKIIVKSAKKSNSKNSSAKINKNNSKESKLSVRQKLELEEQKAKLKAQEENKKIRYENIRNFYLKDLLEKDLEIDEDLRDDEIVKPHEKNLAPYQLDELPPLPILNRSRSQDNYHIPFVYTPKEYIDIMFSAVSLGSVSYFNEAFKYVLNPNITNDQGDTVLTYAIYLKKYAVMASALAKGADPNLPNQLGHLPVSIALELNDFVALEMLAKANADLNYRDLYGRTFLMHASRLGFLPAVDLLVKYNVDINEMDNDGFTALSIAYRYKKELVVQYLLKNGAKTWIEKPFNPQYKSLIKDLNYRWQ